MDKGIMSMILGFTEGFVDAACIEEALLGLLVTQSEGVLKHPCATIHKFGICQLHLYHAITFDTSQADHQ